MATDIIHNGIHSDKSDSKEIKVRCSDKKRQQIKEAYAVTKGNITGMSDILSMPRMQLYRIFRDYPDLKEELEAMDDQIIEDRKEIAVKNLDLLVEDKSLEAIKFTLTKEPRKRLGKTKITKDKMDGIRSMGLILGFDEEPDIE